MSSYEYHQILQFLYFEGYADSYESAECLLESLDDDEFEDLCERATRPTRFPKSVRKEELNYDEFKVIVAHYLFDEGYADSLNGAEVMAENISDNWVQSILSESDIESPKERLVTDRNMFNIPQSERNEAKKRTIAKAMAAREKKKNK